MNLEQLQAALRDTNAKYAALHAKGNAATAEDLDAMESLLTEGESLQKQITDFQARATQLSARGQALNGFASAPNAPMQFPGGEPLSTVPPGYQTPALFTADGTPVPAGHYPGHYAAGVDPAQLVGGRPAALPVIPAQLAKRKTSHIRFEGSEEANTLAAYKMGTWALSLLSSTGLREHPLVRKSAQYCHQHGLSTRWHQDAAGMMTGAIGANFANTEGAGSGAPLVPIELTDTLIRLVETYGVFRKHAEVKPMRSDTMITPRRTQGLTFYSVQEATAPTDSTMGFDMVGLVAKKIIAISYASTELVEDAVIEFGDLLAEEFAYGAALKEDQCGFIGDGTSTYLGIVGATNALKNLSGTIANIAGLFVASGSGYATSYGSIALSDLQNTAALLPQYARERAPGAAWYVSIGFWEGVMRRLALAAGGVPAAEVLDLDPNHLRFLGYPVVITQVMPTVSATSQVCALLGNLRLAAQFGDRRVLTVAVSDQYQWAQDALTWRSTERFDINVHDVGNASGTASARLAGPLVGLITAAS